MDPNKYPLVNKHRIPFKSAQENVDRCIKEQPSLKPDWLTFFKYESGLFKELLDIFGSDVDYEYWIGVSDTNEPCPMILFTDSDGYYLPWPSNEKSNDENEPAVIDVATLCPPFCGGDGDRGLVKNMRPS